MWDVLVDVLLVSAGQFGNIDVLIINAQGIAFAQQFLSQVDNRAVPQVVSSFLKLKPRMPTFLTPFPSPS